MKKYLVDNREEMYVGEASEISALYKSIRRAGDKGRTEILPMFCEFPRFNPNRLYGLSISKGDFSMYPWMCIISSDSVLRLIVNGSAKEVE